MEERPRRYRRCVGRGEYLHGSFNDFISPVPIRKKRESVSRIFFIISFRAAVMRPVDEGRIGQCGRHARPGKRRLPLRHFYEEAAAADARSRAVQFRSCNMRDLPTCPSTNRQLEGSSFITSLTSRNAHPTSSHAPRGSSPSPTALSVNVCGILSRGAMK